MEFFTKTKDQLKQFFQKTDAAKTYEEIIKENLYPCETHFYETLDGYINRVIRINGPRNTTAKSNFQLNDQGYLKKPVVILQHGLLSSCTDWILNGVDNSLAYILADNGYDVWINNSRGNRYSKQHIFLDPQKDKEYWDFSFIEMGRYDLPALFKFIKMKTNVKSISYIGHSQGTSQMFAALSENLEFYKDQMNLFVAISPIVKLKDSTAKILRIFTINDNLEKLLDALGQHEVLSSDENRKIQSGIQSLFPNLNNIGLKMITDEDPNQINKQTYTNFMSHYPMGTSMRTLLHMKQMLMHDRFAYYDYGSEKNLAFYNQELPADIPIQNIQNMPIALLVGTADKLSTLQGACWLVDKLGNQNSLAFYKEYRLGHLAFLIPETTQPYQDILQLVKQYNPQYIPATQ